MSVYTLPYFACVLLVAFLIYFFSKNSDDKTLKRLTFRLLFVTIIWQIGHAVIFSLQNQQQALSIARVSYLGVVFVAVCCADFLYYAGLGKRSKFIRILTNCSFIFLPFILFSNLVISGIYQYKFGLYPKAGVLHIALVMISCTALIHTALSLLKYRKDKQRSLQIKPALFSWFFLSAGVLDYIPNWGIEFPLTGWLWALIGFSITLYFSFFQQFAGLSILADTLQNQIKNEREKSLYLIKVFAHDIKNRLTVGIPTLELCLSTHDKECIQNAIDNEKEMNRMVLSLINVFSEDKITLCKQQLQVPAIAEQLYYNWNSILQGKNIDFQINANEVEFIYGDKDYLSLVWDNLLSNTFQHISNAGEVSIDFSIDETGFNIITFKNSGSSVAQAQVSDLFNKYSIQGKQSAFNKGLGLNYSKMMIELHGGDITYEVQDGKNAFIVRIPPSAIEEEAAVDQQ